MYKRKWILFAVFIVTGTIILVLIHTGDRKPVTSKDPANSRTLSKISSHIRNGANFLQNKNIYGAKEVSGKEERSVFKEKYEVGISRIGEGYKSILPIGSPYNDTKNFESGKQSKHKALNYLAPTNQFLTNYSPLHEMPLSVNAKAVSQPEQKRTSIKNITQSMFLVPKMKGHRSTAEESIDKEEKTDNHLSVQSMDLKLEWLKIREERRTNEEDKLMLQKQRKLLEQQQMELEQEKIKLAEEVRRFTEYRRRLDEIHQKSRTQYEKQATLAPARTIGDLWKGLDPHEVETKYPGVQLDGDYMLRPFVDPDDPRAMGMFGNPHTIEEMTDAQAEERFYQLVSVEHVHCSDVRRMGNMGDGGWDVCVVEPFKPHLGCLIYSFGINNDFTFDDAMSETFSCDVKSFDPSMNVDDYMHSDNVLFYNLGLGSKNNITEKEWNIMTLSAILSKLGHTENTIDYLKFDIEFSEWESLKNMVRERSLANVKQLAFEIHTAEVVHVNRQSNKSDYVRWYTVLLGLEQQGFRRFHYHFNPYGRFTSLRTGRDRSCCYELYYINLKFLDTRDNG